MAWFSGVGLGNLGDLGDFAGSLNKLGEQAASVMNIEKGFDFDEFLSNKEGMEGAAKDQAQPIATAHLGTSLWDAALLQVPREATSASSNVQTDRKDGPESFMPMPLPITSLFGGQQSEGPTPEPSPGKSQDSREGESTLQNHQSPHALNGKVDIPETVDDFSGRVEEVEGWAIEDDITVSEAEEQPLEAFQRAGDEEGAHKEYALEQQLKPELEEDAKSELVKQSPAGIEVRTHDTPAGIVRENPREASAANNLHGSGKTGSAADELHDGWAQEEIEVHGTPQEIAPAPASSKNEEEHAHLRGTPNLEADRVVAAFDDEAAASAGVQQEESLETPAEVEVTEAFVQAHAAVLASTDEGPLGAADVTKSEAESRVAKTEDGAPVTARRESSSLTEELRTVETAAEATEVVLEESSSLGRISFQVGSSVDPAAHILQPGVGEQEEGEETTALHGIRSTACDAVRPATLSKSAPLNMPEASARAAGGAALAAASDASTCLPISNGSLDVATELLERRQEVGQSLGTETFLSEENGPAAAANTVVEAVLAVSPPGRPRIAGGGPVLMPDSAEMAALRDQLRSMEDSMRSASQQAQMRADELAAMMQANDQLKAELAEERGKKNNEAELEALREEYQHRLGAAERKVYALTKERDMLRREQSRKSDTSTLLKEKDEIIKQVMAEGEELSKKQAAQEAAMKKLRTQLREFEDEKQRLASRLQVEEARVESIRKDKAATEKALQEAVERSQSELGAQKDFYHTALAQAKEALLQAEARANVEARADIERKIKEAGERERVLMMSVEELRQTLTRTEQQAAFREQLLRKDLEEMESRCQAAEARHEELVARMPDSTRPLLRQIEALQESTNMRVEALTGVERALNARLSEAEAKAAAAEERERASTERLTQTLSRLAVMEAQLSCLRAEQAQLTRTLEKERHRAAENRSEYLAAQEASAAADMRVKQLEAEVKDLKLKQRRDLQEEKAKREALEQELEADRELHAEYERRRKAEGKNVMDRSNSAALLAQAQQQASLADPFPSVLTALRRHPSSSSTGSMQGEASILAASLTDSFTGYQGTETPRSGSYRANVAPAAAFDQVEALLRQREGEISTYVARVASLEKTRDSLAEELVESTAQVESLKAEVASLPRMRSELDALRKRHAAALELMGERDEQVEELRADLQDVKEMYREQIDLLVRQIEQLGSSMDARIS